MKDIKIKNDLLAKAPGSGGSIITALLSGVLNAPRILVNLLKERPDVAISTGSGELAIPALVMAKWFGIKTIYIETWTRVREPRQLARCFIIQRCLFGPMARFCSPVRKEGEVSGVCYDIFTMGTWDYNFDRSDKCA